MKQISSGGGGGRGGGGRGGGKGARGGGGGRGARGSNTHTSFRKSKKPPPDCLGETERDENGALLLKKRWMEGAERLKKVVVGGENWSCLKIGRITLGGGGERVCVQRRGEGCKDVEWANAHQE